MATIFSVALKTLSTFPKSSAAEYDLLYYLAAVMAGTAIPTVLALMITHSPYGRYGSPKWGAGMHPKVAWVLQELPSFLVPVLLICYTSSDKFSASLTNRVLMGMFLLHYVQRTFIFPLLLRGGKPTPIVPFILAFMFCLYNGYMQGRTLTQYAVYSDTWLHSSVFLTGCLLFFSGMLINLHSDHILRNLRKPGETGYKIPRGGMFEYVSGANFFGESLEWFGWALACNTAQAYAFFFFTICNIGPRALHHHRYYLEKFEDYPKTRKAFIPFIL
ncbi:3-oxo-5-alpha-steroid 4-dehydrogenase 1-like [Ptychodera flava]|uniref:3-oxo-5-alpha-steroid 4-dehydrogenase 1-like n=1 Tax=Ptychodera flava TaxID=63121 RepID=UPI00396A5086